MIKYMISLGFDPTSESDRFEHLVSNGDPEVIFYLIDEYNIDISTSDTDVSYILKNKSLDEKIRIFDMLLERGLNIDNLSINNLLAGIDGIDDIDKILLTKIEKLIHAITKDRYGYNPSRININVYMDLWNRLKKVDISLLSTADLTYFLCYLYDAKTYSLDWRNKIAGEITVDDMVMFVQLGIDVHFRGDYFLRNSCIWTDDKIVRYLVEDCGCDINAEYSMAALVTALKYNRINHAKILLNFGAVITDEVIEKSLASVNYVKLLADYAVDLTKVASILLRTKLLKNERHLCDDRLAIISWLLAQSIDFNQVLIDCLKNN